MSRSQGFASLAARALVRHRFLLLGFLALFTFSRQSQLGAWDEAFYLAQMTSAVADGDLLLQNDLLAFAGDFPAKYRAITTVAGPGAVFNTFSVGPAVLHSAYTWPLLAKRQVPVPPLLRSWLSLGGLAFMALTVMATSAALRRLGFSPATSHVSAALAAFFGPLALYGTRVTFGSHLPGALFASFLLLGLLLWRDEPRTRYALLAGLAAGLLVINRWQDALLVLGLVPAVLLAARKGGSDERRSRAWGLAIAGLAAAATVWIQLVAWRIQFGSWLLIPQGGAYMRWSEPRVGAFLLSTYHGLLPWMPGFALGLLGLGLLWVRASDPWGARLAGGLAVASAVAIYVSACPVDWWGGASFGPRRLASLTPVAALGLAALARAARPFAAVVAAIALSAWVVFVASAFMSGFDDLSVLFRGRPDGWNPSPPAAYAALAWKDGWGPAHFLKPGFTFSEKPRNIDRVVGASAVFLLVAVVAALWAWLRSRVAAQRAAVALALLWVLAAGLWLATAVPRNDAWNPAWKAIVCGSPAEARAEGPPWPRNVDDAADVVHAVNARRDGRLEDARHLEQTRRDRLSTYGIADGSFEAFALDPAHRGLLDSARELACPVP